MPESLGLKVTERQFNNLSSNMVKDLTALFNLMEDDINKLIEQSVKEGWTPEQLIQKIEDLI